MMNWEDEVRWFHLYPLAVSWIDAVDDSASRPSEPVCLFFSKNAEFRDSPTLINEIAKSNPFKVGRWKFHSRRYVWRT
jgi:hypothetical protein